MGEPNNWEKSLQIVIDVLLSNGVPNQKYESLIGNHLPIVAVNTDYLWMSEATNPRYGFEFCCYFSLLKHSPCHWFNLFTLLVLQRLAPDLLTGQYSYAIDELLLLHLLYL